MTRTHDTDTIEAGIERERASLASTLDALQSRVSIDNLAKEALGLVKSNAAVYTRSIDEAVRANPMALALTGVGIAWLIFGGKKGADEPIVAAVDRWEEDGGSAYAYSEGAAFPDDDAWRREIDQLRDTANGSIGKIEADARRHAEAVRRGAVDAFSKVRDFAAERAAVLSEFTDSMKKSFRSGLDDLTESARDKIIAARERAYSARIKGESLARTGTRETGRLIEEYPLVAGVAALAAGAAFAAALPRTRVEDRTFGAESDRLMREATRLMHEERARLGRVTAGVADELKQSSRDVVETVKDEVAGVTRSTASLLSEKLSQSAEAVKERAEKEAGDVASAALSASKKSDVKDIVS